MWQRLVAVTGAAIAAALTLVRSVPAARHEWIAPHARAFVLGPSVPGLHGLPEIAPANLDTADLPQLVLAGVVADTQARFNEAKLGALVGGVTDASAAPDLFFYIWILVAILTVFVALYLLTKGWFEYRDLNDRINQAKLPFLMDSPDVTALDRYKVARLYIQVRDYPAALGEIEETEDEWGDTRRKFDPEDAMGALAARAMLHNSKGYALTVLEPPRRAQARKEFVRAITFWPEYPEALLNIGRELIARKRFEVAIRTIDAALKWLPASEDLQDAAAAAREGLEMQQLEDESDSDED